MNIDNDEQSKSLVPDSVTGGGFFTPMDIAPGEFTALDPKDAHIHVCACGKKFDWYAETIEQALAAQRQALRDEVMAARTMVRCKSCKGAHFYEAVPIEYISTIFEGKGE